MGVSWDSRVHTAHGGPSVKRPPSVAIVVSSSSAPVQYARLSNGVVVIRVLGKGMHLQAPAVRRVFESTRDGDPTPQYVVDLEKCTSMDSTFMGTLAMIGLHQRRTSGEAPIIVNADDHVRYLLNTLGLKYMFRIHGNRDEDTPTAQTGEFQAAPDVEMSLAERTAMMIEAHERLIDADSDNEVKFENVIKTLRDSLDQT